MIRNVNLPTEAPASAVISSVEVAVALAGGVIGVSNENVIPVGGVPTHDPERSTAALKVSNEVTVQLVDAEDPCETFSKGTLQATVKSGVWHGC